MTFNKKLLAAVQDSHSTLCVGLDPNLALLPTELKHKNIAPVKKVAHFLRQVVDATQDHCAAYKPNIGFFEALGPDGWDCFQEILEFIPDKKIIVADAKRGDISTTAEHYARAFFDFFDVDALTLNPLMGFETLDPFLKDDSRSIYVLALTSNPGAEDLFLQTLSSGITLSTHIARQLKEKQKECTGTIGMVVGATQASDLSPVVSEFSQSPLLIPGIGAQGGSIEALTQALQDHQGIPLINSSRSIIYAGNQDRNWSEQVAKAASGMKKQLSPITRNYV